MRELIGTEVMMLEGLYEEERGLPTDPWKVCPDDGAYKSWNVHVRELRKRRLIAGKGGAMRITAAGVAEYERVKASAQYHAIKAEWQRVREAWRKAQDASDAAFVASLSKPK